MQASTNHLCASACFAAAASSSALALTLACLAASFSSCSFLKRAAFSSLYITTPVSNTHLSQATPVLDNTCVYYVPVTFNLLLDKVFMLSLRLLFFLPLVDFLFALAIFFPFYNHTCTQCSNAQNTQLDQVNPTLLLGQCFADKSPLNLATSLPSSRLSISFCLSSSSFCLFFCRRLSSLISSALHNIHNTAVSATLCNSYKDQFKEYIIIFAVFQQKLFVPLQSIIERRGVGLSFTFTSW
jgi:hypothetical protein